MRPTDTPITANPAGTASTLPSVVFAFDSAPVPAVGYPR